MRLDDYKKQRSQFGIPEGYFDELESSILRKTCESNQPIGSTRKPTRTIAWGKWVSYAAMIAIISVVGISITKKNVNREREIQSDIRASLQEGTIDIYEANEFDDEYIDNMFSNFPIDEYTFYSYLTENE
jgi:hypothetical protein